MLAKEDENEAEVRREDQDRINAFGRLNSRLFELRRERDQLKKMLERMDDASTELMMATNPKVMIYIGEAFFEASEDEATEYCEAEVEKYSESVDKLDEEEVKLLEEQEDLKKVLYDRFGTSINLEHDE
mmetsp:Transcript_33374/g.51145  ORF Transcript_33374/g.51145 Transcript_33374/m.51145 type:complete len:129 (+) Transcript_33374:119-505(+)